MKVATYSAKTIIRIMALAGCVWPLAFAAYADRIAFLVPSQIIYPGQAIVQ